MRGAGLPPLVSTSQPGTALGQAGRLGTDGTGLLVGGSAVNGDPRLGIRFTFGGWIDDRHTLGAEVSFFTLEHKVTRFALSSADGSSILARPFIGAGNQQNASVIAFPMDRSGSVLVSETSDGLIGTGFLLRENVYGGDGFRVDVLGGYRYLRLVDRFGVTTSSTNINPNSGTPLNQVTDVTDYFGSKNEFHGFDAGLTAEVRRGPLALTVLGKLAFGYNHQAVDIAGAMTVTPPGGPPMPSAGGLLTAATNIGHHSRDEVSLVPELGLKVGYQVTPRVRASLGYTLFYWDDVARAAEEVDLTINQAATSRRPAFDFHKNGLWAQGLDLGVEYRF
jgi:hypothetical protein